MVEFISNPSYEYLSMQQRKKNINIERERKKKRLWIILLNMTALKWRALYRRVGQRVEQSTLLARWRSVQIGCEQSLETPQELHWNSMHSLHKFQTDERLNSYKIHNLFNRSCRTKMKKRFGILSYILLWIVLKSNSISRTIFNISKIELSEACLTEKQILICQG